MILNYKEIVLILLGLLLLTSCSQQDTEAPVADGGEAAVELLFSVSANNSVTRQAPEIVQADGQPFRGLQDLTIMSFRTGGTAVAEDDAPLIIYGYGNEYIDDVDGQHYYYSGKCNISIGTDRVLAYGRATTVENPDPKVNGQLETTLVNRMRPGGLTFSLSQIYPTADAHNNAEDIAHYLTAIANTDGWSTTNISELKVLYQEFIHATSTENGIICGSAAHVSAHVAELREALVDIGGELANSIIANIDNTDDYNNCLNNNYPGNIGLPDGAAALRWSQNAFQVRTETTALDNINGIIRYVYPPELWYFVDSPILTSEAKVTKDVYQNYSWGGLLGYYLDGHTVGRDTKAVAVQQPLQYAVGRFQITLNTINGTLRDSKDEVVNYGDPTKLPLRGVIIGGQHTVGYNFAPRGIQSDVDARFIYDTQIGTTNTVNTLVLQSYDNEAVPIALEFENLTGSKFAGKDGIVYPNTKFYLLGTLDPVGKGYGAYKDRVFTKDYVTKATITVNTLANAYACMPDLLSPRLEIGVQIETQWVQSSTTTVKL